MEDQNPWDAVDSSLMPLRNSLILAEKVGLMRMESDSNTSKLLSTLSDTSPSLKLIELLRAMAMTRKELNKVDMEIQLRMQDKEMSDITDLDIQEERIKKVSSLNSHIQSIVENKAQIITRLQQPVVGDYIKLEAQYHRYASELFKQIAPLLADLTTHLENITWTKTLVFTDGKLNSLLSELSDTLAGLQTSFQSLCQMRETMMRLQQT